MHMALEPSTWHAAFDQQALVTPRVVAAVSWSRSAACRQALLYSEVQQRSLELAAGLAHHLDAVISQLGGADGEDSACGRRSRIAAVHIPRVHEDFMPVMLALSRLGLPFVLLSTDIPDKNLEDARNMYILETLRPCVRLVVSRDIKNVLDFTTLPGASAGEVLALDEITGNGVTEKYMPTGSDSCQILCYMFTGGTQRTKIVKTTHAMLLHERSAYKELWRPQSRPVVLAHTSVYWGASALGQMSIAFAFAGTVVWTDSHEVSDLLKCISEEGITVLGLVPDHLDLLAPQLPQRELPQVEAVFTWGERLPRRLIDRWRSHPRAVLRELLIATEYWLTFWSDPLNDDGVLRCVSAADVLVLAEDGSAAKMGEVGTLCIGGPMVMAGYHTSANSQGPVASCFHFDQNHRRYLRTSDLVRRVPSGIVYKGRADMMAKDKGKWVDMLAIEDKILKLDKMSAVKIVPDPVNEYFHAFLVLVPGVLAGPVLDAVRVHLPQRVQLWVVPELPRHPVTRKVDTKRLLEMRAEEWTRNWPIEGDPGFAGGTPLLCERFFVKMMSCIKWVMITFTISLAVARNSDTTSTPLAMTVGWLGVHICLWNIIQDKSQRAICTLMVTTCWCMATLYVQVYSKCITESIVSLIAITYGWLSAIYLDEQRQKKKRFGTAMMAVLDGLPFQKMGVFVTLSLFQYRSDWLGWLCFCLLWFISSFGILIALRKQRLLAWPIIFWCLGGHQMEVDCGLWMRYHFLWTHCVWWLCWLRSAIYNYLGIALLVSLVQRPAAATKGGRSYSYSDSVAVSPARYCVQCGGDVRSFPVRDALGWQSGWQPQTELCAACAADVVGQLEAAALSWIEDLFSDGLDVASTLPRMRKKWLYSVLDEPEPPAKRQRVESDPSTNTCTDNANMLASDSFENSGSTDTANSTSLSEDEKKAWLEIQRRKNIEKWWWWNYKVTMFDLSRSEEEWIATMLSGEKVEGNEHVASNGHLEVDGAEGHSPEASLLCSIIAQIEPELKPVNMRTVLMGLDSLRIVRLSNAIKTQLRRSIPVSRMREATTVHKLVELVADTEEDARDDADAASCADAIGDTFAVWFSPGQYSPMGNWVLRSDDRVDIAALTKATQQLVDRHPATRVEMIDPVRYMSLLYDAATIFALCVPMMESLPWPFRILRRVMSWALERGWPRIQIFSREDVYGSRFPETAAPVTVIPMSSGQSYFEFILKQRRFAMLPPAGVALYELSCHIEDAWTWHYGWIGSFVIMRTPDKLKDAIGSKLIYVDAASNEWGPLLSPTSKLWKSPPYGFPALFFVPLSKGGMLWLRLERDDEMRACYKDGLGTAFPPHHLVGYRTARQRDKKVHEPVVVSFLAVGMFHSFADGSCYLPLIHDLLSFYDSARKQVGPPALPPVASVFGELEKRLMDTFNCRSSPMRASLRGSIFKYTGRGYGHDIGLEPGVIRAVAKVASHYRVPLDVALLGLVVCAMARADHTELLEFTLYVPMRDGLAEAMSVGLFSDWRDISFSIDFKLATVIGTIMQVSHKIQHRQWSPFNALRKPERNVVNIQPLDFERKSGFMHLGENLWHGGDQLRKVKTREKSMEWVRQPATIVIEQQDEENWWVLLNVAWDVRPATWMRSFLYGFRDGLRSFLLDPLALVHQPMPRDHDLLLAYAGEGGVLGGWWGPQLLKAARSAADEASQESKS